MNFENIIGNEENKELLKSIIKNKNISHSYMFTGTNGIGKLLFAKEFAKEILNSEKSLENNPDFYVIEPIGNTIKIDQIRDIIKKTFEKPISSDKKIYIINDSNKMTKEAQNALLKTLEEPPQYVVIILIAENKNLFLPTIKSRCTEIFFNKLTDDEVKEILIKNYGYNPNSTILKMANGSAYKAIQLKDDNCNYDQIERTFLNLNNITLIDAINSKDLIFKNKDNINEILEYINLIFMQETKKQKTEYINCIQIVEDTKERLKRNNNYDMTIDNLIMKLWEEING
jgi:DNA polymerase-3 subunit delta'